MKRMFISLLVVLISNFSFSQDQILRLASSVWPPFTDEQGKTAFAQELVNEALKRKSIKSTTHIVRVGSVVTNIRNGNYDGSGALWYLKEREDIVIYSDPYLRNQLVLVGRKGSDVRVNSLNELAGKSVGIIINYGYGEAIEQAKEVDFIVSTSIQENLDRLVSEELDYILVDALLIQYLITNQASEVEDNLEIGTTPLVTRSLHLGIRVDYPDAENIIKQFNESIMEMIADGTYNSILELNWIKADVDGDGKMELILGGNRAGTAPPQTGYNINLPGTVGTQGSNNRFYVEGKIYTGWDNVPSRYKMAPIKTEDFNKSKLLKLKF